MTRSLTRNSIVELLQNCIKPFKKDGIKCNLAVASESILCYYSPFDHKQSDLSDWGLEDVTSTLVAKTAIGRILLFRQPLYNIDSKFPYLTSQQSSTTTQDEG